MEISIDRVIALTEEYGGQWGLNHSKRLLENISEIGEGLQYDHEAVTLAAYLHDWGAYTQWMKPEVDHSVRSRQVAEEFLTGNGCENHIKDLVLECIEYRHTAAAGNSIEAVLLSDADALDFLGVVGILRDFSKNSKDLRNAYTSIKSRREKLPERIILEKSRRISHERIEIMDELLKEFEKETYGFF